MWKLHTLQQPKKKASCKELGIYQEGDFPFLYYPHIGNYETLYLFLVFLADWFGDVVIHRISIGIGCFAICTYTS